jgi:hypothetical protein
MRTSSVFISMSVFAIVFTGKASASLLAADSAADAAYNGGWAAGSNGGYGFGPWSFVNYGGGTPICFVGTSTTNGDGGDINTAGRAWGMRPSGDTYAVRPFSGALEVGQSVRFDMDNGFSGIGQVVGVRLINSLTALDSFNTNEFEFRLLDLNNGYPYQAYASPIQFSPHRFTDGGFRVTFTLITSLAFSLSVTRYHDTEPTTTWNISGELARGNPVVGLALHSNSGGNPVSFYEYFNSIVITPEPASLGLLAMGMFMLRRRKRI